jgi:hypothetical protein
VLEAEVVVEAEVRRTDDSVLQVHHNDDVIHWIDSSSLASLSSRSSASLVMPTQARQRGSESVTDVSLGILANTSKVMWMKAATWLAHTIDHGVCVAEESM